jgi:serine protease Do
MVATAQFADLVAKNEKAIVQIFSYDEFGAPSSTGTGFFIKTDGTGLTNLHVLNEAKYGFIRSYNGEVYQIERITRICRDCDLAEFTVNNKNKTFPILTIVNTIPLKGSDIFVIGNPEGLESSVSKGIVSAIREENNKVVQISAPISPGSSGSPIMDMNGNVFAIATYQHKEGQNLNFGYWLGCREKLKANTELNISNSSSKNLYVLNQICKTESNLILNSIEVNEKNTILNLTFTNTSLAFGDRAFIFATIGDKETSFYIEDILTRKKHYAYDATIGNSPKDPTILKLGESKRFKLYFPSIGNATHLNIAEGMKGSDWSFHDINLTTNKSFLFNDEKFFNNFYYQTGLAFLSDKDFANAYIILNDFVSKNNDNDNAHNLAGIISYILGNNLDAFLHINKAISINPTNDSYYFNLYYLNSASGSTDEAIKNMSSAIQLNNDQPEYYGYRASLYMQKEYWKEAIKDFDKYINSDRVIPGYTYFQRGLAKLWIQDKTACKDLQTAYQLTDNEEGRKKITEWYNKYCR